MKGDTKRPWVVRGTEQAVSKILGELRNFVDELALTDEVVKALLPSGRPHDFETELWDYKEKLPVLPHAPTDDDKKRHKAELGEMMKDVLAFYNAYGGYIVFGIANKGKDRVRGCDTEFDCGDFNKRLHAYTEANIECLYRVVPVAKTSNAPSIGLLLVPRRPTGVTPVRFRREGPEKPNGGRSFSKETYVRVRDECRPATASSEDWAFLHSDRTPDARSSSFRQQVQSLLPARDPDLVEFVGREEALSELRMWLTDRRSPVRLVTGIGGLGKTTLAFRFAEEVVETGAGEIEWVIWLTAKQQTFSALLGKLIATSKVDFGDLASLYGAILKALSYDMPLEDEEEPTLDDLADRVVDAMSVYSCLLIVDDIDSLAPDEQKETVAALNGIALRTIGRDLAPSRVLLTSRIDQGLPPTAVVKISGLDRKAFDSHVSNLCATFQIPSIKGDVLKELFEATSGSPLFAASIVRLVSLGENLRDVVETWRGEEGEGVRRFAFQREISRLDVGQARLLYAVLLLGETSVNDLAAALEVTAKVVRDRISELQAYHLISTATKETGDALIFAPTDLVVVTEILRSHLGPYADAVETACARAQERSRTDSRSIGVGIRSVLRAWEGGRYQEAVVIASQLRERFPKSGDVASILGAALLRVSPPRIREADRELEEARRLGCTRSELLSNVIRVKSDLSDWQSVYAITRPLSSNNVSHDEPLTAFLLACRKLIAIAKDRGDHARIGELAIEAVEKITAKLTRQRLDQALLNTLVNNRFDFAREYIIALVRLNPRAGDKLDVFEGVVRLAEADVVLSDLMGIGLSALQDWWGDVEGRPVVDLVACSILGRQLRRLEKIQRQVESYKSANPRIVAEISKVVHDLAYRGARLSG